MNYFKQIRLLFLTAIIWASNIFPAFALTDTAALDNALTDTAQYIYQSVPSPQVGSTGGEWAVLGLARSGFSVPDSYYQTYYKTVESYAAAHKGILHDKKYTEHSRVIIALTAIGKDPRSVSGYDLTLPLGDYEKTIWQGLNGPIWALIALDSGNYPMPQNRNAKVQATRDMYIEHILACQLNDGGWSLTAAPKDTQSDPDITGMALQALAKYQDKPAVKNATEKALICISNQQSDDGGFSSWGEPNAESHVQIIVALCELGISLEDSRFVKSGNNITDAFMTFYKQGSGFLHSKNGTGVGQMASEQGLYTLAAIKRNQQNQPTLYRITDPLKIDESANEPIFGLPGKHSDIHFMPIIEKGKTFADIQLHENQDAIECLSSRGIINGKTTESFDPNGKMTRAEFAAIIVRSLGLNAKANQQFIDVSADAWHAPYIGTAYQYGIITGTSANTFAPNATITKQEAAVMIARAAKLCGMDSEMDKSAVRDMLAQFTDYKQTDSWAQDALAFCFKSEILDQSATEIQPKIAIKRCEIAQMLYFMLDKSQLL